jgi:integrase
VRRQKPSGPSLVAFFGSMYFRALRSAAAATLRKANLALPGDGASCAEEVASSLARRPYDLRHAAVSTWLNAGVPSIRVAEWAGHSVAVLLQIYQVHRRPGGRGPASHRPGPCLLGGLKT